MLKRQKMLYFPSYHLLFILILLKLYIQLGFTKNCGMYILFALSNNLTYPKNNEDSGKAETNPYPHDADKASIQDDI